jgi:starch synthase
MIFKFASDFFGVPERYFTPEFIELNGSASFLKAGCVFADRLSTVSPTYAVEICRSDYGEGLEGILPRGGSDLSGILTASTRTFLIRQ